MNLEYQLSPGLCAMAFLPKGSTVRDLRDATRDWLKTSTPITAKEMIDYLTDCQIKQPKFAYSLNIKEVNQFF
jgi:hypothetical protein